MLIIADVHPHCKTRSRKVKHIAVIFSFCKLSPVWQLIDSVEIERKSLSYSRRTSRNYSINARLLFIFIYFVATPSHLQNKDKQKITKKTTERSAEHKLINMICWINFRLPFLLNSHKKGSIAGILFENREKY